MFVKNELQVVVFCHFALLPYMQVGEIKKEALPDTRTHQASFFTPR